MKFRLTSTLLLFLLIFVSCNNGNRFQINTDKNRVNVQIHRFDKDLILLDTNNIISSVKNLYKKYPDFLPAYIQNLDTVSPDDTVAVTHSLKKFVAYPSLHTIHRKVLSTFSDVSNIEKEISDAYTYIHFYFPQLKLPEVYFFVSGLALPIMMDENMNFIGIGNDFYLGSDFEPYKSFIYDYMLYNMRPESVSVDLTSAVLFYYFRFDSKQNRLIDNMIHRGKVLYLLSVFMPEKEKKDIIGYSENQWNWSEKNEKEIWKTMISQKALFSSDEILIRQYLNDAPFTTPISQESPGRLGAWVGMRIVASYMNHHRKITLQQLMQTNDYQSILEKSEYNP